MCIDHFFCLIIGWIDVCFSTQDFPLVLFVLWGFDVLAWIVNDQWLDLCIFSCSLFRYLFDQDVSFLHHRIILQVLLGLRNMAWDLFLDSVKLFWRNPVSFGLELLLDRLLFVFPLHFWWCKNFLNHRLFGNFLLIPLFLFLWFPWTLFRCFLYCFSFDKDLLLNLFLLCFCIHFCLLHS